MNKIFMSRIQLQLYPVLFCPETIILTHRAVNVPCVLDKKVKNYSYSQVDYLCDCVYEMSSCDSDLSVHCDDEITD